MNRVSTLLPTLPCPPTLPSNPQLPPDDYFRLRQWTGVKVKSFHYRQLGKYDD